MIKNFYRLPLVDDNVLELPLNASSIGAFKNDNFESDFVKNFDAFIEKSILIDRMKALQSFGGEWYTKPAYCKILEWIRNFIERSEILPVNGSGFWRLVITWIDRRIYWRSRADYPQSISSFFFENLKTKKRRILIEANVITFMQSRKKPSLSRFLQTAESRNDRATQKVYSDFSDRQSFLSEMIYRKIITYAGLTNETKIILLKSRIRRRYK